MLFIRSVLYYILCSIELHKFTKIIYAFVYLINILKLLMYLFQYLHMNILILYSYRFILNKRKNIYRYFINSRGSSKIHSFMETQFLSQWFFQFNVLSCPSMNSYFLHQWNLRKLIFNKNWRNHSKLSKLEPRETHRGKPFS